ncbi:C1-like protein [Tanacetum coccineum]
MEEITAVKEKALYLRHEAHPQHELTLVIRPGAYYCYACLTNEKDFFYVCILCNFSIHETCALSPPIVMLPFHSHPLLLVYSLPERIYNFTYYCSMCRKRINPNAWIYHCAICRHFVHFKCALNKQHPIPRDELPDDDKDKEEKPDPLQLGDFEITHFSHNHPLAEITEKPEKIGGVIVCNLCGKSLVDGSTSYGCIKCPYFLHKACTQLEPTINHHFHPHEPLTFTDVSSMTWRYWYCDVCRLKGPYEGFCYSSSHKDKWLLFIACIACCLAERARVAEISAIKEQAMIKREHQGYPGHTLTLQLRPASFKCDACNSKEEDLFYQCDSCDFWIHKSCASLGPTLNLPHHPQDPLELVYSLPERYFAHVKCALNAEKLPTLRDGSGTSAEQEYINDFTHFPKSYVFTDPLKILHSGKVDDGGDKAELNDHWSHNHPLILNVASSGNNMPNVDSSDSIEVVSATVIHLCSDVKLVSSALM